MGFSLQLFVAEKITHAHDDIDLLCTEPREEMTPDGLRMHRSGGFQPLAAGFSKYDEHSLPAAPLAQDEFSFLHPGQLVREPALVPAHHRGQHLLPHLAFPDGRQTGENAELRAGKACCLRDISPDACEHVFAHKPEGVPDAKLTWG